MSELQTMKISSETYITQAKILKTSTRTEIRESFICKKQFGGIAIYGGSCGAKRTEKF